MGVLNAGDLCNWLVNYAEQLTALPHVYMRRCIFTKPRSLMNYEASEVVRQSLGDEPRRDGMITNNGCARAGTF